MQPGLKTKPQSVAVIGAGNSAHALACYLIHLGFSVKLCARNLEKISYLKETKHIQSTGKLEGNFLLDTVTNDPRQALGDVSLIFVATVTTAYPEIARWIGPYLTSNQKVILFSGKLLGVWDFYSALKKIRSDFSSIWETDALLACRLQPDHSVWIRGIKKWNLFSTLSSAHQSEGKFLQEIFPGLEPATHPIQRGLTDFGALTHSIIMLANMNRVDRAEEFLFYVDGLTPRTASLAEQLFLEFQEIARAYETNLISPTELLFRYYGEKRETLFETMRAVPNYKSSIAPKSLDHRYLIEDVSCSLVAAQSLARAAHLTTPLLDSVLAFTSVLLQRNFLAEGRNFSRLGWENSSKEDIVHHLTTPLQKAD